MNLSLRLYFFFKILIFSDAGWQNACLNTQIHLYVRQFMDLKEDRWSFYQQALETLKIKNRWLFFLEEMSGWVNPKNSSSYAPSALFYILEALKRGFEFEELWI